MSDAENVPNLWDIAERQAQLESDRRQPYPGRWSYTWLGGNVEPVMQPISRTDVEDEDGHVDMLKWAVAWADRVQRGHEPVYTSTFHVHDSALCFAGQPEMINLKMQLPDQVGILDAQTGHWVTVRIATSEESRDTRIGLDVKGPGPGPHALPVYR
jgi:hypothetical protein